LPAIALTGPRGGSDAGKLSLRIERAGSDYLINGEKTSISAADQADAVVVFGRTGTVDSGAHGVTALLVPTAASGLTRSRFDGHGQRAIGRGSLFFENVRVPVDHRLGDGVRCSTAPWSLSISPRYCHTGSLRSNRILSRPDQR